MNIDRYTVYCKHEFHIIRLSNKCLFFDVVLVAKINKNKNAMISNNNENTENTTNIFTYCSLFYIRVFVLK